MPPSLRRARRHLRDPAGVAAPDPWLARWGLTPNQVTVANAVLGLAAAALVATGSRGAVAAGGLAIFASVVLDSCDGELARIRHLYSAFGRTLDNVSDDVIDIAMTVALAVALGGWWVPVALVAAAARASCAAMIFRAVARAGKPGDVLAFRWFFDRADSELTERFARRVTPLALVRALGRRDAYVLVWTLACLTGVLAPGLIVGLAVAYGYFGLSLAHRVVRARRAPADRAGM
ncbi:MAG: CDP-alcohol phosphatidyltransferase family protein [Kofleriaceae bacterium]